MSELHTSINKLPTTASVLPALGMMSGLLFAAGMFMQRFRKTS